METNYFFLLAQVIMLVVGGYFTFRRVKSQNILDDSTASVNYRKLVIDLQAEVKDLQQLLDRSHLEVSMSIKMGEQPTVTSWRWLRREDDANVVPD